MNWAALDPGLLAWPLAAAALVLATHLPLGREVLARGIIFLDLAVAQVAGLGILVAASLGWPAAGWRMQAAALAAALLAGAGMRLAERRWPAIQEPLIGSVFVLAASLGSLLAAGDPHGSEQLRDILVGQVLWVSPTQVGTAALAMLAAMAVWWRWRRQGWAFYLAFAICVTQSVQLLGVYLVFASLIFPALAVRGLAARAALPRGYAIGVLGCVAGLAASALFDLPAGGVMVVTLACAALLLARRRA
ncbi:MAG: metal ABC transporter permease [Pseudomonadota bacterium]